MVASKGSEADAADAPQGLSLLAMKKKEKGRRRRKRSWTCGVRRASALGWILELLDLVGSGPAGHRTRRQCPAHDDASPSLSVGTGSGGRVLLHCHAGCSLDSVLTALSIGPRHLYKASTLTPAQHVALFRLRLTFPTVRHGGRPGRGRGGAAKLQAVHDYGDFRLMRYRRHPVTGDKTLKWEHRTTGGIWIPGLGGTLLVDLPLYLEGQARLGAAAGEPVLVVESESSVDALTRAGLYTTTWAGGAASPNLARLAKVLGRATVVVIADNDDSGLCCADRIITHLRRAGARVATLVPDQPGEDARDILTSLGRDRLERLIRQATRPGKEAATQRHPHIAPSG